ncbi:sigma factor-like helix-turn-helix DNA-binding protein [Kribbella voronezhensis]|nr:sigma factor-like helix-turn-helix DNA-binding protein [Kribbella voronezhensis]
MEPFPDALLDDDATQFLQVSFIAALQQLPPFHRAAVVLCDVMGFPVAEVADMLDISATAATAALQSGRCALAGQVAAGRRHRTLPGAEAARILAERFAAALERGDREQLAALLTDDVRLSVPPATNDHLGRPAVTASLGQYCAGRGVRLVPTRANGQPAFGCYTADSRTRIATLDCLMVLTLEGARISVITRFLGIPRCEAFGLPRTLPAD